MVVLMKKYGLMPRAQLEESTMTCATEIIRSRSACGAFTRGHLADELVEHPGAPAAGQAEPAGLVLEEVQDGLDHVDDAGGVVHDQHGAGTQGAFGLGHGHVFHGGVQVLVFKEPERRAAGLTGLELAAVFDAAAVLVDELPHGHAAVGFDDAGVLHLAHHLEDLGARGVRGALGLVPLGAVDEDGRYAGQGLDVVNDGGLAPDADDTGEGRLDPGVAAFAFDGLDERGFLAADI